MSNFSNKTQKWNELSNLTFKEKIFFNGVVLYLYTITHNQKEEDLNKEFIFARLSKKMCQDKEKKNL